MYDLSKWTGKTPVVLLQELCQKKKWLKPQYFTVCGTLKYGGVLSSVPPLPFNSPLYLSSPNYLPSLPFLSSFLSPSPSRLSPLPPLPLTSPPSLPFQPSLLHPLFPPSHPSYRSSHPSHLSPPPPR